MSDEMTSDLAAISLLEDEDGAPYPEDVQEAFRFRLLAHIDALTAKVEKMEMAPNYDYDDVVDRAAVLAILRGEA